MLINTRAIGFPPTDALVRHVDFHLASSLEPFSRHVTRIMVRLEDVNADRGGIDKRCSIVAALRRRRVQFAEATESDLYAAIENAARKIHRAVSTAVSWRRSRERKDRQRPGALVEL